MAEVDGARETLGGAATRKILQQETYECPEPRYDRQAPARRLRSNASVVSWHSLIATSSESLVWQQRLLGVSPLRTDRELAENRYVIENMERETGLEPVTSSLGSWHSTTELLPLGRWVQTPIASPHGKLACTQILANPALLA